MKGGNSAKDTENEMNCQTSIIGIGPFGQHGDDLMHGKEIN
jgi:hypothetical protein